MKKRRSRDITKIGGEQSRLLDGGLTPEAALRHAERSVGLPLEPGIAYYFRRFPSLGDALCEILVEKPAESTELRVKRLSSAPYRGMGGLVMMAKLGGAIREAAVRIRAEVGRAVRNDRDDVETVRHFLERNAASLSALLGRKVLWPSLVRREPAADSPMSGEGPEVMARALLGQLIGGLFLAYEDPRQFFRSFAREVDPHRFDRKRFQDSKTRATAVADVLFAWGIGALLNPNVNSAFRLLSSDAAGFRRADDAIANRLPYTDGRPPKLVTPTPPGRRISVHAERAKLVLAVAQWLDPAVRFGVREKTETEATIRHAGLWSVVGPRRGDEDCSAPQKEAENIVARHFSTRRTTIRQSIRRAKRP